MNDSASQPSVGVLLLCGPSGAGKSRLAAEWLRGYGWPTVELDDFYREGTDPSLPRLPLGLPDWDDVDSWDRDSALSAVMDLCGHGEAQIPRYDITASIVTGTRRVSSDGAPVIVAEGIFAARLIEPLASLGLLAGAWCIRDYHG